jgi:hypothetical protein
MPRSITLSDDLYERLEKEARRREQASVEQLLQVWEAEEREREERRRVGREINAFREYLREKCGEMPDSVPLIREDRER